jgi:hypothetical protein
LVKCGRRLSPSKDVGMTTKVLLEVDARHESILRRALAMVEEMEQLALSTPDGAVFDVCEDAVIHKGRDLQRRMLSDAVAKRIEAAEKRGPLCAAVPADARKKTAGPSRAS